MHRTVPRRPRTSARVGGLAVLALLLGATLSLPPRAGSTTTTTPGGAVNWPNVTDLSAKLRSELPTLPGPDPSHTNSEAYARSLAPWVLSGSEPAAPPSGSALLRTNLYPGASGYLRIGTIRAGLADSLRSAVDGLRKDGPLAGLVLDLRFADGTDFESGIAAASIFASNAPAEFRLGAATWRTQRNPDPLAVPILILVNRQTRQAAEALASAVRTVASKAIVLGTPTAGQARTYRPVAVSESLTLRVAADALRLPDGSEFPASGLKPDLVVAVSEADERAYAVDEYRRVVEGRSMPSARVGRLNEAELVRRRRGPRSPFEESASPDAGDSGGLVQSDTGRASLDDPPRSVQDPALAVALDLVSGIAANAAESQAPARAPGESR